MAEKKIIVTPKAPATASRTFSKDPALNKQKRLPLFEKDNYMWMGIGAVIVAIGMFIMSGGKNADPNQFDTKLVYSTTRITIAPILIMLGFVVEIYAIFKRPQNALLVERKESELAK